MSQCDTEVKLKMGNYRFIHTTPSAQPSSGYASRISPEIWSCFEIVIRQVHRQGAPREEVLRVLVDDYGFRPTIGQLRDQMARWGLKSSRKGPSTSASTSASASTQSPASIIDPGSTSGSPSTLCSNFYDPAYTFTYANIPTSCLTDLWSMFDTANLQLSVATEVEMLADVLFCGGRYTAAFSLYLSLYHQISETERASREDFSAIRFRTLIGCLRSAGNSQQRAQALSIAENDLPSSPQSHLCDPNHMVLGQENRICICSMSHFYSREYLRSAMPPSQNSSSDSVFSENWKIEAQDLEVFRWYFRRLKSADFVSAYEEEITLYNTRPLSWTHDGLQSLVYWYLVTSAVADPDTSPPCLTISRLISSKYRLTECETFALVAAVINSDRWISSWSPLWSSALESWLDTILADQEIFVQCFQQAVKRVMMPDFIMRNDKTELDAVAAANKCPSYYAPSSHKLKMLAAQLNIGSIVTDSQCGCYGRRTNDRFCSTSPTYGNLVIAHRTLVNSYVTENYAYGTSYEPSRRPKDSAHKESSICSVEHAGALVRSPKSPISRISDPMLISCTGGSRSSFRSFQSLYNRTKTQTSSWRNSSALSMTSNRSSNLSEHLPMLLVSD